MKDQFQIETSKTGKPTLRLNSVYLHSKYDPIKEGKQIAESVSITKKKCLVIFGLGLGYHILPYSKNTLLKIIVIEKYSKLINLVKELKTLNIKDNINIFTGNIDELKIYLYNIINEYESDGIITLTHKSSFRAEPSYYNKAKDILANVQKVKLQSYITSLAFSKRWHENILKNIKYLPKLYTLSKQQTNIPIFIIASGPSLNNNIHILSKIQRKGIIIALAPTYKLLKEHNINPHFLISIDAGIANRIHTINNDVNNKNKLCLITTMSVTPFIFREWKGKILLINHQLPSENNIISSFPSIPMQGTVSISAFNIAKLISKGDIYLIGFDFALTDENYHYRGNSMEELILYSNNKIETVETKLFKLINKFQLSKVKSVGNSYIKTNAAMKSYLSHLEKEISKTTNIVFNLNSKGAYIKGARQASFKEIINLTNTRFNAVEIITKIPEENYQDSKRQMNKILDCYIQTKELINKSAISMEELFYFISTLPSYFREIFNFSQTRILKKLSKTKIDPETKEDLIYSLGRTINLLKKVSHNKN